MWLDLSHPEIFLQHLPEYMAMGICLYKQSHRRWQFQIIRRSEGKYTTSNGSLSLHLFISRFFMEMHSSPHSCP